MRKNMNADKLLKIAKLLDEKNHFALADKVDKIAQNISVSNKTIVAQFTRDYFGLDQTGSGMDNFLKNTRMRLPSGASFIPGLSNQDKRVMGPFGIDLGSKRFVQRQQAFGRGLRNLVTNTPEYQQYQARYNPQQNQQQQPQKQDPLLISTTPDQFVNNLFEYGKKFGLSNFTQTMDLYANQGGTLNGKPINQNPQALGLYDQVKNYSGNLTPQQILAMLSGSGQ
jgi:hypothetical protein